MPHADTPLAPRGHHCSSVRGMGGLMPHADTPPGAPGTPLQLCQGNRTPTDVSRGHGLGAVDGSAAVVEVFPQSDDTVVDLGGGAQTEFHQGAEVLSGQQEQGLAVNLLSGGESPGQIQFCVLKGQCY